MEAGPHRCPFYQRTPSNYRVNTGQSPGMATSTAKVWHQNTRIGSNLMCQGKAAFEIRIIDGGLVESK